VYIEKYKLGPLHDIRSLAKPELHRCYVELPGECSLDCPFCGSPALFQCGICGKAEGNPDMPKVESFLRRVMATECKNVMFHGGDPISSLDQLVAAFECCRKYGYRGGISVITNGSQVDQEVVGLLSEFKIGIILPVFLSGSVDQERYLASTLNLCRQSGVPVMLTTVRLEEETADVSGLSRRVSEMKSDYSQTAMIYNKRRDSPRYIQSQMLETPRRVRANVYYHMKRHHPCLWGAIAMAHQGDILPCPHLRTEVLGNVGDSYWLERMFEDESIYDYWDLPLSSIDKCRDCAFQLGCLDCRALEMRITGDLYGKQLCSLPEKAGIRGQSE
jgi:radical SAM protein with 4Fe4S-binding SPASM domain